MQLSNISISAIDYDNRYFTRSLTATVMNTETTATVQATGSELISWNFPATDISAFYGVSAYTVNQLLPVSSIGTMVFYFSATPYNYRTENYTLCTIDIKCNRFVGNTRVQQAVYTQTYDTFPNIDLELYINYQNTGTDTLFYRTTSNTPFAADVQLRSTSYNLVTAVSSDNHAAWFTLNNDTTKNYLSGETYNFIRTSPGLSSVQAAISASSAPDTLSAWYSPHILERELKVYFIPEFPTASFIAYPSGYFPNIQTFDTLDSNTYTSSPGVCFYGEGHTENIILCAANIGNYNYNWLINKPEYGYQVIDNNTSSAHSTYTVITSKQDFYPKLPIALLVSDGVTLTNLLSYSEEFDQSSEEFALSSVWITSLINVSSNVINSPYGAQTADKIIPTNSNGYHDIRQNYTLPVAGEYYTASIFLKAGGYSQALVSWGLLNTAANIGVEVNLNDGSFDSSDSGTPTVTTRSVTDYGNGWYRISVGGIFSPTETSACLRVWPNGKTSYQGNNVDGIYAWGAQLEKKPIAGTYIQTTNAPVSSFTTVNYISTDGPVFYYDDNTGTKTYYPFYDSTLDPQGNESSTNTKYKQSISVNPYDSSLVINFEPGLPAFLYLPINGAPREFTAESIAYLNTPRAVSACYDKYDTIWKWSTFEECSALAMPSPSSWTTVECSGTYPKRWALEGFSELSAQTPTYETLSGQVWSLSAYTANRLPWVDYIVEDDINQESYTFSLQLSGYGGELLDVPGFTVSNFNNTIVTLKSEHTIYSQMNPLIPNLPDDWSVKISKFINTFEFTTFSPYKLHTYTPNKYVLLNEPVTFENLFINAGGALSAVELILDDVAGEVVYLTGDDITKDFTVSYSTVGYKTIKITGYSPFYQETFSVTLPDVVRVFANYDDVNTEAYFNFNKILTDLPWKTQPSVGSNDWVVSDNINSCIKMFNDNLNHLNNRSFVYQDTYNEYVGWLGSEPTVIQGITACPLWTWDDTDCTSPENIQSYVTWQDLMSGGVIPEVNETGNLAYCGTWEQQTCSLSSVVPNCLGKYCVEWKWASRKSINTNNIITWKDTKCANNYEKKWRTPLEECETVKNVNCDEGVWNVNLPGLDTFYDPIPECYSQNKCSYRGIVSHKNILYTALNTQVKILSSDRTASFFDLRTSFNETTPFVDIQGIALNSKQKMYILDSTLSQVTVYDYNPSAVGERWTLVTTFGGVGGSLSKTKFLNPTNLHIDQYDNVWIVDSGNFVLKRYTDTGSWLFTLRDDDYFRTDAPLDVCVDSADCVHVLTAKVVRVYSYNGEFLFTYTPGEDILPLTSHNKIAASYNRETIYIASKSQVIRHFRTGGFSGTIIDSRQCVDNINDIFHDEYRNLLVANDDKILKFVDTMTIVPLKSKLPQQYWSLDDLLIHDEEYVQNWVYTKVLHRVWDNIEIFRNTLLYNDTGTCKRYVPPVHSKDKITIGQNEIVTSTVINRSLKYLWDNLNTLLEYYNTNC